MFVVKQTNGSKNSGFEALVHETKRVLILSQGREGVSHTQSTLRDTTTFLPMIETEVSSLEVFLGIGVW